MEMKLKSVRQRHTVPDQQGDALNVRDVSVVNGSQLRKVISASCLGNAVEWYDFSVYGYLAIIIGKVFFTAAPPAVQTILALVTFSIPFLVRPLGAAIFGTLGDKYGRKRVLTLTIILISLSTCAIGLIPGYSAIGVLAPVLILLAKIIQGLSVGGEYAGAMTFVAEYSPDRHRGFLASWLDFGSVAGFLFGILVVFAVSQFAGGELKPEGWEWRIPFLLSLPLGLIGLFLRSNIEESPAFQHEGEKRENDSQGVMAIIRANGRGIILCCCLVIMTNVAYYMVLVFMPTYFTEVLHFNRDHAEKITICIMIGMLILQPVFGWLSDKIGRRPFIFIGSLGYLVLSWPAFWLLQHNDLVSHVYAGLAILAFLLCCFNSIMAAVLPALFPTAVRLRTLGISFNISVFVAGITPPIAAYLVGSRTGAGGFSHFWPYAPAYILIGIALISIIAGLLLRESAGKPLKGALPVAASKQEAREVFQEHLDRIEDRVSALNDKISELEEKRDSLVDKHPNLSQQ